MVDLSKTIGGPPREEVERSERPTVVVMIDILVGDYPLFFSHLRSDRRLPPTYAQWRRESYVTGMAHKSVGSATERVVVHYEDFITHVTKAELAATYGVLL